MSKKYKGECLRFDERDSNGTIFSRDCIESLVIPKKVPVLVDFEPDFIIGEAELSLTSEGIMGMFTLDDDVKTDDKIIKALKLSPKVTGEFTEANGVKVLKNIEFQGVSMVPEHSLINIKTIQEVKEDE